MSTFVAVIAGVVCGVAATMPVFNELRRDNPDLGRGFGAVIGAFVAIQALMLVLYVWCPPYVLPFGVTAVLIFLLLVVVAAITRARSDK
ncbi:MAG: hypothetical protein Q4D48_03810 [Coriobacteriales bacterium]|nr:hypothetical protein [Coriobacteriales bacterium]